MSDPKREFTPHDEAFESYVRDKFPGRVKRVGVYQLRKAFIAGAEFAKDQHRNALVAKDKELQTVARHRDEYQQRAYAAEHTPASETGGWVRCSERMPDDGQIVMVWAKDDDDWGWTVAQWDADAKEWADRLDISCREDINDTEVTHWRPAPEGPK